MSIFYPSKEQEIALCNELGLISERVRSIDFHVRPGEFVTATVEYFVPPEVAERIFASPIPARHASEALRKDPVPPGWMNEEAPTVVYPRDPRL